MFHKHHNIPDDIEDIHLHFDSFKTSLETKFKHLKEATSHNMQNIQMSLSVQQTYSSTLCSHVNNIYSKLSELQKLIQHCCMYSHQGDTMQIEAPELDPDIDGDSPLNTDEKHGKVLIQGTLATIPETSELEDDDSIAPGTNTDPTKLPKTDWPDTPPMQIPRVSSPTAQLPEQRYNRRQVQPSTENFKIPELEKNSEEEQFTDFDSFMTHHNTHQASEHIRQEYFSHYKIWMMTNIMLKLTEPIFLSIHRLHNTIARQIIKKVHNDPWKNSKEYLAEAEVKPDEKNYMAIDHLALDLVLCKAAFNARSRRISICMKGTLPTVNISILFVHNVSAASCQVHIKGYQLNVQHNNNMQNQDINHLTETNKLGID